MERTVSFTFTFRGTESGESNHADHPALILFGMDFDSLGNWGRCGNQLIWLAPGIVQRKVNRRCRTGRGARPGRRYLNVARL